MNRGGRIVFMVAAMLAMQLSIVEGRSFWFATYGSGPFVRLDNQ